MCNTKLLEENIRQDHKYSLWLLLNCIRSSPGEYIRIYYKSQRGVLIESITFLWLNIPPCRPANVSSSIVHQKEGINQKSKFPTKTCKMWRFSPFTKSLMIDDWWLKRENQGLRIKDRRIKQPIMSKGSEQSAWISECMIVRLVVWQMWPLWTQLLAILFLEGKYIREI